MVLLLECVMALRGPSKLIAIWFCYEHCYSLFLSYNICQKRALNALIDMCGPWRMRMSFFRCTWVFVEKLEPWLSQGCLCLILFCMCMCKMDIRSSSTDSFSLFPQCPSTKKEDNLLMITKLHGLSCQLMILTFSTIYYPGEFIQDLSSTQSQYDILLNIPCHLEYWIVFSIDSPEMPPTWMVE